MPKRSDEPVFVLIKSMNKAEKRHFKLFVNRIRNGHTPKFVQLYDVLDLQEQYDEHAVLEAVPEIKPGQLPNLKQHLYRQLLTSLRLNASVHDPELELHEQVDFAKILYNKGLYRQSLRLLERTKSKAYALQLDELIMDILMLEKTIELQYVTADKETVAKELTSETKKINRVLDSMNEYSNLAIMIYALYQKTGYIRNKEDFRKVTQYFHSYLPNYNLNHMSFNEKIYLYRSYVWYNTMVQDFVTTYRYALKWVELIEENDLTLPKAPLYLTGLNFLMNALFQLNQYQRFTQAFEKMEAFEQKHKLHLNQNVSILLFEVKALHEINRLFLLGSFTSGIPVVRKISQELKVWEKWLDHQTLLLLYYKLACVYFGAGEFYRSIDYLNKIIYFKRTTVREDIQSFARILLLVSYYELGEDESVDQKIRSTYHFISRMKDLQKFQKEILRFLRQIPRLYPQEIKSAFQELKDRMLVIARDPYEQRPFFYFDIISWLESKIEDVPVEVVIRERGLGFLRPS